MDIVYWAPHGAIERIYFNIPRQRLVEVWMEPAERSRQFRWDYRLVVATNVFFRQPELRRKFVEAVRAYVTQQVEEQLRGAGKPIAWSAVTWHDLAALQGKLGTVRARRPGSSNKKIAASLAMNSVQ